VSNSEESNNYDLADVMAGYSSTWDCRICKQSQTTVDCPKARVCEDCIRPIAERLCYDAIEKNYNTPGIDRGYWDIKAYDQVNFLMRRWKNEPVST